MNTQETIRILMPVEDVSIVQEIFNRTQEPDFTIINSYTLPETTVAMVELAVKSSMTVWFLAKSVEMEQEYNRRFEQFKKQINTSVEEIRKKTFNE